MQKNVNLYALVLFPQQTNPLSAFFIYCMSFFFLVSESYLRIECIDEQEEKKLREKFVV